MDVKYEFKLLNSRLNARRMRVEGVLTHRSVLFRRLQYSPNGVGVRVTPWQSVFLL